VGERMCPTMPAAGVLSYAGSRCAPNGRLEQGRPHSWIAGRHIMARRYRRGYMPQCYGECYRNSGILMILCIRYPEPRGPWHSNACANAGWCNLFTETGARAHSRTDGWRWNRQADRQTARQTGRQTGMQTDRHTYRQEHIGTDRQTDWNMCQGALKDRRVALDVLVLA
jgi:hypothetical protein